MKLMRTTVALLAGGLMASAQAVTVLTENFNSVAALAGSGWVFSNNSAPVGQDWFQGNAGVFAALEGAADAYIGVNFLSTATTSGVVDNWLISPLLTLGAPGTLSFSTRASDVDFLDLLEVRFSSGASSAVASFTATLTTVGNATTAAYPVAGWTAYTVALPNVVNGRFAFRYSVADAANASYIGIDTVSVSVVPEPTSAVLFGLGLAGLAGLAGPAGLARRRQPRALALALVLCAGAPTAVLAADAMRVVLDPLTGELRSPNAAEAAAFAKAEQQLRQGKGKAPATAAVEIRYADGTVETKLGDDTVMYSVVRANADGTLDKRCLPAQQARVFVKPTASVSKAQSKAGL